MKKIIYIFLFLFPFTVNAQQFWHQSCQSNYIWLNVGNPGFSPGKTQFTSLVFNTFDSLPYVAFQDQGNSWKATVMKFDGTNWIVVGNPGFSSAEADWIALAFCPTDHEPYVVFQDYGSAQKATVMKFDGTNWIYVGFQGLS